MRDSHVRESISKLKQDIAARVAESRAMAADARALTGAERHSKQMERRAFGRQTRWCLLAYAWLRGRPYARAEPRAVVPVDPYAVRRVLGGLGVEVEAGAVRRWVEGAAAGGDAPAPRPAAVQSEVEGAVCAASSTS